MIEEKEYTTGSDGIKIIRKRTEAETQVNKRKIAGWNSSRFCFQIFKSETFKLLFRELILLLLAHQFISHLPKESQLPEANPYIPQLLSGAIFCGHLVSYSTVLNSISSSIDCVHVCDS